jgi:hypothetical protein
MHRKTWAWTAAIRKLVTEHEAKLVRGENQLTK